MKVGTKGTGVSCNGHGLYLGLRVYGCDFCNVWTSASPARMLSGRQVGTGQSVKEGLGHPKP